MSRSGAAGIVAIRPHSKADEFLTGINTKSVCWKYQLISLEIMNLLSERARINPTKVWIRVRSTECSLILPKGNPIIPLVSLERMEQTGRCPCGCSQPSNEDRKLLLCYFRFCRRQMKCPALSDCVLSFELTPTDKRETEKVAAILM